MSPLEWAGMVAAFLGCACTFVGVVFYGGKLVGRIEMVAADFGKMQDRLDMIPGMQQQLEFHNEWIDRLDKRTDSTRAHAIRAEAHSQHDRE